MVVVAMVVGFFFGGCGCGGSVMMIAMVCGDGVW